MGPVSVASHHHRSTTKKDKKGFKARHATKGALKEQNKGKNNTVLCIKNLLTQSQAKSSPYPSNVAAERPLTNKSCPSSTVAIAQSKCA